MRVAGRAFSRVSGRRCREAADEGPHPAVREADLAAVLVKWLGEKPAAGHGAIETPEALAREDESFLRELFTIYVEQSPTASWSRS